MDWFKFMQEAGPYSAPLCTVMLGGLIWLARDRARVLEALAVANDDRLAIRDLRTQDLERSTKEFTAQAITLGEVVREFNNKVDHLFERMR